MQVVADLHLHSKYSRAVSQDMVLPTMIHYALKKGIDLLSVSDWTHPLWLKEISNQLDEAGEGVYRLKNQNAKIKTTAQKYEAQKEPKFIFSTEISSIYTQKGKLRRIHNLIFVPSITVAEKVNRKLASQGANLNADGRPIIGLAAKDLLSLILEVDQRCFLIPAHVWTPHFGVYGSASGFDSLDEAFGDLAKYVYGIETGLSSDPEMNWQIRELQHRSILSFSDAHSPAKMGRELTVFEMDELCFEQLRRAVMLSGVNEDQNIHSRLGMQPKTSPRILYTIEFYPEEGKYHYSGHRACKVVFGPEEIKKQGSICPVCGKNLTEGVLYRLQQLSGNSLEDLVDKKVNSSGLVWFTHKKKLKPPFVKLVPLNEIIAESLGSTVFSLKSKQLFDALCSKLGSEIEVLLRSSIGDIERIAGTVVAEGIQKVRKGQIVIQPGYDGEYGRVSIWQASQVQSRGHSPQLSLEL